MDQLPNPQHRTPSSEKTYQSNFETSLPSDMGCATPRLVITWSRTSPPLTRAAVSSLGLNVRKASSVFFPGTARPQTTCQPRAPIRPSPPLAPPFPPSHQKGFPNICFLSFPPSPSVLSSPPPPLTPPSQRKGSKSSIFHPHSFHHLPFYLPPPFPLLPRRLAKTG